MSINVYKKPQCTMYGQSNLDILHRPKQDDCEYVRRRQHRIFRGYHGIDMQEEEDGKNGCINEKSQDDVFDVVYKYSTDTNVLRPPLWGSCGRCLILQCFLIISVETLIYIW